MQWIPFYWNKTYSSVSWTTPEQQTKYCFRFWCFKKANQIDLAKHSNWGLLPKPPEKSLPCTQQIKCVPRKYLFVFRLTLLDLRGGGGGVYYDTDFFYRIKCNFNMKSNCRSLLTVKVCPSPSFAETNWRLQREQPLNFFHFCLTFRFDFWKVPNLEFWIYRPFL